MTGRLTVSLQFAALFSFVTTGTMAQTSNMGVTHTPPTTQATSQSAPTNGTAEEYSSWGAYDATGRGFLIGRNEFGELMLGAYAVIRYVNQLPADQTFTDHLGNVRVIDPRNDIQFHRAMVHLKGWLFNEKLRYQTTIWSVLSTNQTTLYGFAGYRFNRKFNAYAGINTIGGSRSLMGSHPLWLANDRVMADEFFRPGFTGAAWVNGEVTPGLWYNVAVGNSLSQLGFTASQLTRDLATGATVWWMPTTKEFGPNGAYGDWEYHDQVATRFGISEYRSRENRFNNDPTKATADNYQVKLADSLLLFSTGSLAPDVTVNFAEVRGLAFDAGVKYRGIFLQAEVYHRWLSDFDADGPLPVSSIHDHGFYVQGAFYPIKQKLELYGATSWVYGDRTAGFDTSHEYIQGLNYFPFDSRYVRLNVQVIEVDRSPVSSLFGFYVGGQKGTTVSSALSFVF